VHSLNRRLLVSVSVALVAFFGVTIATLDTTFRHVTDRALEDLLDAQMVALIAAAEPQPGGGFGPARALDPRLNTPRSGLYAQIRASQPSATPETLWRSPSTAGTFIDFGPALPPGATRFSTSSLPDDGRVAMASRGISFENDAGESRDLTFSVATSLAAHDRQLLVFRTRLFGWFVALTLLLLATLAVLLRWVLSPARRLEREINAVEAGKRESLGGGYPRELTGVATNLNALLLGERKRVARYRDTLGNLAHSLKTPLAVMRAALGARGPSEGAAAEPLSASAIASLNAEIDRMSGIIEHQLKRAAASGGALLGQAPVEVGPVAAELRAALLKVYGQKDMALELALSADAQFVGDRGDLTELLGNLLDNACKWCRFQVRLSASRDPAAGARQRLRLTVEDDGPGVGDADRDRVLERGVRADEQVPGHGLGLAMVRDTVDLYGGTLAISRSSLGGLQVTVRLPGR
jgi:two-component system sensor histidine kinase PhoQ